MYYIKADLKDDIDNYSNFKEYMTRKFLLAYSKDLSK